MDFSICSEDTPYEKKSYLLNRVTSRFDTMIDYNMSKNNIQYNDYVKDETRELSYFFDIKYLIEDKLPHFEWKLKHRRKISKQYQNLTIRKMGDCYPNNFSFTVPV